MLACLLLGRTTLFFPCLLECFHTVAWECVLLSLPYMTETCWSYDHDGCKGHQLPLGTVWQTRSQHSVRLLDRRISTCSVTSSSRNYCVAFSIHFRYLYARQATPELRPNWFHLTTACCAAVVRNPYRHERNVIYGVSFLETRFV
jgi:hypothetical protein